MIPLFFNTMEKLESGLLPKLPSTTMWGVTRYAETNVVGSEVRTRSDGDLSGSKTTILAEQNFYTVYENANDDYKKFAAALRITAGETCRTCSDVRICARSCTDIIC